MIYNAKYDLWVSKDGLVYRYNKKKDKLVLRGFKNTQGYVSVQVKNVGRLNVHRIVYETFVGEIPQDYQIDHINTIRDDNRLENLRCVTRKENQNNPLTKQHMSEAQKGRNFSSETREKIRLSRLDKSFSNFGTKYKEHFGYGKSVNELQYKREWIYYKRHNEVCRWEVEECKS